MISELEPEIVDAFREKTHENNDFIRMYFVDYKSENDIEGKDIWSKICSCMDWLTVAVEGIEKPNENKNMNVASLKFTQFLISIDMIIEAVNHLWISIGTVNNVKQPYLNDRSVFDGQEFNKKYTDEKYFKEIRSWFGVHAVNGNEVKVKFEDHETSVRFFSSWSFNCIFNKDKFSIILYSNNASAEEKYGGIKTVYVNDIIRFASLRYNTLKELMKEIDLIYSQVKKRLQNTAVQLDTTLSDLEQMKQLYRQSRERKLTAEYYEYMIEDYLSFLSCDIEAFSASDKKIVMDYLTDLKPIISVYHKIVQEVDDYKYKIFDLLTMRSETYRQNQYNFSKVLEYARGSIVDSGLISLETLIENKLLPSYSTNLSGQCLHLLIHALDYYYIGL